MQALFSWTRVSRMFKKIIKKTQFKVCRKEAGKKLMHVGWSSKKAASEFFDRQSNTRPGYMNKVKKSHWP